MGKGGTSGKKHAGLGERTYLRETGKAVEESSECWRNLKACGARIKIKKLEARWSPDRRKQYVVLKTKGEQETALMVG